MIHRRFHPNPESRDRKLARLKRNFHRALRLPIQPPGKPVTSKATV